MLPPAIVQLPFAFQMFMFLSLGTTAIGGKGTNRGQIRVDAQLVRFPQPLWLPASFQSSTREGVKSFDIKRKRIVSLLSLGDSTGFRVAGPSQSGASRF